MAAALTAAGRGVPLAAGDIDKVKSQLNADFAVNFTVAYAVEPVGDPVAIGKAMYEKYKARFATCSAPDQVYY